MSFYPYFSIKDTVGFIILIIILTILTLKEPYILEMPSGLILSEGNTPSYI